MAIALNSLSAAHAPSLSDAALVEPETKWAIHALIQTILCGEDPTREETPEQWRARVEQMAHDLGQRAYSA